MKFGLILIQQIEKYNAIKLFYLSRYAPKLNEVEGRINKILKADICSNYAYKNLEELKKDTSRYLKENE
jgi:hypothetical protein